MSVGVLSELTTDSRHAASWDSTSLSGCSPSSQRELRSELGQHADYDMRDSSDRQGVLASDILLLESSVVDKLIPSSNVSVSLVPQ